MKINQIKVGAILSYVVIGLNMIGLVYTPILTRMLGQSEYGLYSLVASIISYLSILDFGFGNAIIIYTTRYRVKKQKEQENKLHGMFFVIYCIIGIIALFIGIILYLNVDKFFGNSMSVEELQKARILMSILIFNLVLTFPLSVFGSIITAYEKFVFNKILKIIQILILPMIMIPLLFMGYKSIALVVVTTIVHIGCLLINAIYCLKKLGIKVRFKGFDKSLLKEIFAYSFFIFLGIVIDKANWSVDQFILGSLVSTVAVAVYNVASQFNQMYLSFSTAINGVLLPKVTKIEAENSTPEQFTDIFIKTGRIQYIVLGLIITGFVIFGEYFINLLYGSEYNASYIVACILMVPVTIPLIQNIGINIMQAKNKHKFRTVVLLIISIANVIISIPLTKLYGPVGAAIGTGISFIIGQGLILNIYYYKVININIPKFWIEILKMSIPIVITFIIGILMKQFIGYNTIIIYIVQIIIYSLIYCVLMWLLGMNKYEKNLFAKPVKLIFEKVKKKLNANK